MASVARLLKNCALTADEIARRTELELDRVGEILGGSSVTMRELRTLSKGLGIPLEAFSRGQLFSLSSAKARALYRVADYARDFSPPVEQIAEYVTSALRVLPKSSYSKAWFREFTAREQSFAEAHRLAGQFRAMFLSDRLDEPFLKLPAVLSEHGLAHLSLLSKSRLEGASVAVAGHVFIFLSPRFPARMLFTLAHELGHVVSEHGEEGTAVFERSSQIGGIRRKPKQESFVDAFASVLLMPDRGVGRFLRTARETLGISDPAIGDIELLLLARYFGVSFAVAARRCEDLGLVPRGGALAISRRLNKEFGSPEKRAQDAGLPPRPTVEFPRISRELQLGIIEAIDHGAVSAGWAADRFGVSVGELHDWHAKSSSGLRD